jgi:spore coat protein CotH
MVPRISRAAIVAAVLSAAVACGSDSSQDGQAAAREASAGGGATVGLFDESVVHSIEVEFDHADYDAMIETFVETGEKESIEATVTIDGVTYERAGLRLKGNSSLAGLGGGFGGRGGPGGADAADDADDAEETGDTDPQGSTDESEPGGGEGPGVGSSGRASADEPEQLPWLIELDEFVDQSHDGYEDVVIRSNGSATALNEAVALDLLEEAGLASQEAMATSFSVNGSEAVLRLAIEHPDDDGWYERAFDAAAGALYKAESTGDWSYRGDDPDAYDEVFDQEGGDDVADLTPLTEFLQFLSESDDATFESELPERLDVDAFATYLAMMELIGNFDDIDGPGNNAYLWWDEDSEQFTVVPWDMNLAFGGGGGGFGGAGGFGGGPGGDVQLPEGVDPDELPDGLELPEGAEPPPGVDPGDLPEGFEPGAIPDGGGPAGGRGGFGSGGNVLVERFHENAQFEALYQEKLTELRSELYESGVAAEILGGWVETLTDGATDLVDQDTVSAEADAVQGQFETE